MKLNKDYFERREISDFVRIIEDPERRINNPETAGRMQNVNRRMFHEWIEQYDTRRGKNFNPNISGASPSLRSFVKCMI